MSALFSIIPRTSTKAALVLAAICMTVLPQSAHGQDESTPEVTEEPDPTAASLPDRPYTGAPLDDTTIFTGTVANFENKTESEVKDDITGGMGIGDDEVEIISYDEETGTVEFKFVGANAGESAGRFAALEDEDHELLGFVSGSPRIKNDRGLDDESSWETPVAIVGALLALSLCAAIIAALVVRKKREEKRGQKGAQMVEDPSNAGGLAVAVPGLETVAPQVQAANSDLDLLPTANTDFQNSDLDSDFMRPQASEFVGAGGGEYGLQAVNTYDLSRLAGMGMAVDDNSDFDILL